MTFGATVRAVTRSRLIPTRAALSLTPAAVKKVADITSRQQCQVTYCILQGGPKVTTHKQPFNNSLNWYQNRLHISENID